MYDTFWGLRSSPFQPEAHDAYFFLSPTHDEAAARLDYLVDNQRRLGVLVGEAGTGKSRFMRWYATQLSNRQHTVGTVSLLGIGQQEFLWQVAEALYARPESGDPLFGLWRRIQHQLLSRRYDEGHVVLLLDDADEAQREVLDCIVRLVHIEPTPRLRLTIVLACEPERMLRLGKRLLDHSDLHIELEPWSTADIQTYLQQALASAGRQSPILTDEAIERLFLRGRGNQRLTAQLIDLALLAAAAQERFEVGSDVIDEVHEQLLSKRSVAPVGLS